MQFIRHYFALMLKRLHSFKRDPKGLCFLVFIPLIAILCVVAAVRVRPCRSSTARFYIVPRGMLTLSIDGGQVNAFLDAPDLQLSTYPLNRAKNVPNRVPYMDYRASWPPLGYALSTR
jgi:hypothetical protein